jgi:hypothetical protein
VSVRQVYFDLNTFPEYINLFIAITWYPEYIVIMFVRSQYSFLYCVHIIVTSTCSRPIWSENDKYSSSNSVWNPGSVCLRWRCACAQGFIALECIPACYSALECRNHSFDSVWILSTGWSWQRGCRLSCYFAICTLQLQVLARICWTCSFSHFSCPNGNQTSVVPNLVWRRWVAAILMCDNSRKGH